MITQVNFCDLQKHNYLFTMYYRTATQITRKPDFDGLEYFQHSRSAILNMLGFPELLNSSALNLTSSNTKLTSDGPKSNTEFQKVQKKVTKNKNHKSGKLCLTL